MPDLFQLVSIVSIVIAASLSACCRMNCFLTSCIENNIIVLTHNLIFEKQFDDDTIDLETYVEEKQPLLSTIN